MMSPVTKEETHQSSGSSGGGGGSSWRKAAAASPKPPEQQPLKCPRCDSPNTKFCYYNNYSLTQPRHFCKTCRRYWTKGGALRNVPIGGGCRKNKKIKSSSSSSLSSGADDHLNYLHSKDLLSPSEFGLGGLKFFHGLSPAVDFQLGSLSSSLPRATTTSPATGFNLYTQFSPFSGISSSSINVGGLDLSSIGCSSSAAFAAATTTSILGFNYPILKNGEHNGGFSGSIQEMGLINGNCNLSSSIESLSSINQELHWKLQQQRLAMLYGNEGENQKENHCISSVSAAVQIEKPQPILFQNLETSNSRKNGPIEWFFDSSFAPVSATPTNSESNKNENTGCSLNGVHQQQYTHDLHQFNGLP
ncbi:hypothetical protein Ancab_003604 [Ancistrocladus abbreviatus]